MQKENSHLSLVEDFKGIADPRIDRTKDHDLTDILVVAVCALLCVAESFNDMEDFGKAKEPWFRTFLRWTQSVRQAVAQEVVALDGKALSCWAYNRKKFRCVSPGSLFRTSPRKSQWNAGWSRSAPGKPLTTAKGSVRKKGPTACW